MPQRGLKLRKGLRTHTQNNNSVLTLSPPADWLLGAALWHQKAARGYKPSDGDCYGLGVCRGLGYTVVYRP